jgi:ribosomal protein S18 acetylase RimI-like enzyme
MALTIRAPRRPDLAALTAIRATFRSDTTLRVSTHSAGLDMRWELTEVRLPEVYDKGDAYDLLPIEVEQIAERARRDDCLVRVVEADGGIVAVLDLEIEHWNNTGILWNLLVDVDYRGRGIGSTLFRRGVAWCRRRNVRTMVIETQSNNVPACRFYVRMGCRLAGIHDRYYTNHDVENGEVAVFWSYDLSDTAPDAFSDSAGG